jgi:saccharopine dehydrogenase-like NADP-dependent oxidoreductase
MVDKIVIIGGTGRIGSSVASFLLHFIESNLTDLNKKIRVVIAGRNKIRGNEICEHLGKKTEFQAVDLNHYHTITELIEDTNLVIHTAGPFVGYAPVVLQACIEKKVPYIDICDDIGYAHRAKKYHPNAVQIGIPAITTAGIFPGIDNIIAAELIESGRSYKKMAPTPIESVEFNTYVAGSGGAGPAVLASTFKIAGKPVRIYKNNILKLRTAFTRRKRFIFPKPIGKKNLYYFDLPEVISIHEVYGVHNIISRFGTAPQIWNKMSYFSGKLMKLKQFREGDYLDKYIEKAMPFVRKLDQKVGRAVAVSVTVIGADNIKREGIYIHSDTVKATGIGVSLLALEILEGHVNPGVFYPEEAILPQFRKELLKRISLTSTFFSIDE